MSRRGGGQAVDLARDLVGSNADIDLFQNSSVHGDAVCGPTSTTTVNGNATVSGSTTPAPDLVELPPIVVPTYASSGALTMVSPAFGA